LASHFVWAVPLLFGTIAAEMNLTKLRCSMRSHYIQLNHPPLKPADCRPIATYGQPRISRQINPER
jgi:hypothetical protein